MNKEYKTNSFGNDGKLCVNPDWTVKYMYNLHEYGGFGNIGIKDAIEWLAMSLDGVPFGEVSQYCKKHNPFVIFNIRAQNKEVKYYYNEV